MTTATTPTLTALRVIPVAGRDSMLLNLSGAHGPFFTRNIVLLIDSAGHTGIGEVPGGEKIRKTIDDARALLLGQPIGNYLNLLQQAQSSFADRDTGGRGYDAVNQDSEPHGGASPLARGFRQ